MVHCWNMAKALRCKPSSVIAIRDEFTAYAFDSAVTRWGLAFDRAIEEAAGEAKTKQAAESKVQQVVRRWIPSTRRYAEMKR